MRQGNDVGTQYRSGVYCVLRGAARDRRGVADAYQQRLDEAGYGPITTEIVEAPEFYYAEDYHQQYLAKVPNGYCGLGGTGVDLPVGRRSPTEAQRRLSAPRGASLRAAPRRA